MLSIYFIDFYLSVFCLKDDFFDIVFDLQINKDTYDFEQGKYKNPTNKCIWKIVYIFFNGLILLSCIYVLIFMLIPLIYYRIGQCSKKNTRISEFKDTMDNNTSILKERFTTDP